jgi:hypothetical protein
MTIRAMLLFSATDHAYNLEGIGLPKTIMISDSTKSLVIYRMFSHNY